MAPGFDDDSRDSVHDRCLSGKVSAALRWYVSSPEYQRRLVQCLLYPLWLSPRSLGRLRLHREK